MVEHVSRQRRENDVSKFEKPRKETFIRLKAQERKAQKRDKKYIVDLGAGTNTLCRTHLIDAPHSLYPLAELSGMYELLLVMSTEGDQLWLIGVLELHVSDRRSATNMISQAGHAVAFQHKPAMACAKTRYDEQRSSTLI